MPLKYDYYVLHINQSQTLDVQQRTSNTYYASIKGGLSFSYLQDLSDDGWLLNATDDYAFYFSRPREPEITQDKAPSIEI